MGLGDCEGTLKSSGIFSEAQRGVLLFVLSGVLGPCLGRVLMYQGIHFLGVARAVPMLATGPLFTGILDMDDDGYVIALARSTETNIKGVFAAGDVQDHVYRQAVTAAASGCMAALDAERYVAALEHATDEVAA